MKKYTPIRQYTSSEHLEAIELLFGRLWISTGGKARALHFGRSLRLKTGAAVLDVGCGRGGLAFLLQDLYKAVTHGIDITQLNIEIANEERMKRMKEGAPYKGTFELVSFDDFLSDELFDCIVSLDALVHLGEHRNVFQKVSNLLSSSGVFSFETYVLEKKTNEMIEYIEKNSYTINEHQKNIDILCSVGFVDIQDEDISDEFYRFSNHELDTAILQGVDIYRGALERRIRRLDERQQSVRRYRARKT